QRQARAQRVAAALPFRRRKPSTVELDPLADAEKPIAARLGATSAGAVIDDLELEVVTAIADDNDDAGRLCVLQHVRQSLLHDSVRREVEACGQQLWLAFDAQLRLDSGGARLLDET